MKASVSIQGNVSMKLDEALLIYRTERGHGSAYITRHRVNNGSLGPVEPLSYEFVSDLSEALKQEMKLEILPSNVLARTSDTIVWWTPEQRRQMFFTASDRLDNATHLSGKTYPQPALVWMVRRDNLYVRALLHSERPTAGTHLYVAPYWNVSDTGHVCTGDMKRPDTRSVDGIPTWEEGFFASKFSHPNATKIVVNAGGYLRLLESLADAQRFPFNALVLSKQTLGQFIKERD